MAASSTSVVNSAFDRPPRIRGAGAVRSWYPDGRRGQHDLDWYGVWRPHVGKFGCLPERSSFTHPNNTSSSSSRSSKRRLGSPPKGRVGHHLKGIHGASMVDDHGALAPVLWGSSDARILQARPISHRKLLLIGGCLVLPKCPPNSRATKRRFRSAPCTVTPAREAARVPGRVPGAPHRILRLLGEVALHLPYRGFGRQRLLHTLFTKYQPGYTGPQPSHGTTPLKTPERPHGPRQGGKRVYSKVDARWRRRIWLESITDRGVREYASDVQPIATREMREPPAHPRRAVAVRKG